ncbi:NUMOD1 domain-containing DNA-binding protein [uncultured Maribacter sp.]|uniref:NUMOD1 domain-containing DNA-binding protein n=1 Tax=uncultured Maribacter sp. TaxID=431308 RepID=UPI002611ACD1|nr:NUMOD1 domain-containing DNA-binding protein [uncultured Maribacter sp.]
MNIENSFIIYKAVNNLNNKSYIGATTKGINQRKWDHTERAQRGEENKFHNAIRTYGEDAFIWEQLDTANSINELAQKEKEYIIKYNAKEEGYNGSCGGDFKKRIYQYDLITGKLIKTFESLKEASNEVKSTKQHISRACLSVNNVYGGYFWSYDYKETFIPQKDLRKRQVLQFNLEGILVATYVSVAEASRQTGVSKTCISRCCRGERLHSSGFKWAYELKD